MRATNPKCEIVSLVKSDDVEPIIDIVYGGWGAPGRQGEGEQKNAALTYLGSAASRGGRRTSQLTAKSTA